MPASSQKVRCSHCHAALPPDHTGPCPNCGKPGKVIDVGIAEEINIASSVTAALVELSRGRTHQAVAADTNIGIEPLRAVANLVAPAAQLSGRAEVIYPDVLLQAAVVSLGSSTPDGSIVEAVAPPWLEILKQLEQDPDFLFEIHWRKLEEIVAGAYTRAGWQNVVLTPRSGDGGRDVIATKPGVCSVRIFDQIKAYRPGHVVTADEVRSMLGVLQAHPNVSKGLVTTTSSFAPGIEKDSGLCAFMPYRLELKSGNELRKWLVSLLRNT